MIVSGVSRANLVLGWVWILLGFGSGALMGLRFHQPDWLGGYSSHKRRLYRLGHISFFGLGAVNFLFAMTAAACVGCIALEVASKAFLIGAITMPLACLLFAHNARLHLIFSIPVTALLGGAVLTLIALL